MNLSINQKIKLKITRQLVILGFFSGLVYILFYHGFSDPPRYIVGAVSGILLGLLMSYYELVLFTRGAKKLRFIWLLILRGLVYLISIVLIISLTAAISRMVRWDMSFIDVLVNPDYYIGYLMGVDFSVAVTYSMFLAFSVNFLRMLSRKMGQGVLISYVNGTYYAPVHQARIVMFIRLNNANEILAKLGPEQFFNLLNDIYFDYSVPVVTHLGIIHEYVEDLAVITWSVDKGLAHGNAIKSYFAIWETLRNRQTYYGDTYGLHPEVVAALHIGSIIRSEIGEVKAQIVLHGDTMNTTSRMLNYGMGEGHGFVTSQPLLHMIELPAGVTKGDLGPVALKGKTEHMYLFKLTEIDHEE